MVETGLENLLNNYSACLQGRRIGVLCHAASVDSRFRHILTCLRDVGADVRAVFGPQHGLFGQTQDNMIEWYGDEHSPASEKVAEYSLYGKTRRPTQQMLSSVDLLLADLQDVGARPYTYIWTVKECMYAASRFNIPMIVTDRPNPAALCGIDGPVLSREYYSFVGGAEIPLAHTMTMGELALWLKHHTFPDIDLTVIPMKGWCRSMSFQETGLPWVLPSPNIPTPDTTLVYPGMVLFETVNVSEGRGTTLPFSFFGAPWVRKSAFRECLDNIWPGQRGVVFREHDFIPTFNKYGGEYCSGYALHVVSPKDFAPVTCAAAVLKALRMSSPDEFQLLDPPYEYDYSNMPMDIVSGDPRLREWLETSDPVAELTHCWQDEQKLFSEQLENTAIYKEQ
ncbi:MAG: exo-beta-N-acetylmuramidase NamZ family protein [Fibrobacterota bacterium]